jgi:hypothetical protein
MVGLGCTSRINDVGPGGSTNNGTQGGTGNGMPASGSTSVGGDGTPMGSGGSTTDPGTGTGGTTGVDPGMVTAPKTPFEPATALVALRKVKNLLTGLAPTDAEAALVSGSGAAGLQQLINSWMTQADTQAAFRDKMIFLFRNLFQQTGFVPTEDFKPQLLTNGGFDFGGFGGPGDDAFTLLVQNLQDSFAQTTWALIAEGRPFTETLTTSRYMMTTGLKSLYLQIEMPREQRNAATPALAFRVDESGAEIPLEQSLDPASPNYMTFADVAPVNPGRTGNGTICRGTAGMVNPYTGFAQLFQVLLGFIPRYSATQGVTTCQQHSSKPYFTTADMSDWQWVTTRPLAAGEAQLMPYDLPKLRTSTELGLKLPRVGFFTTPAFLALWNTNDSNQHRVTANQTLLVALGQSFSSANSIIPVSENGLDAQHSVDSSECYGCHKSLDPMRQFWATQLDFNDRNDFPTRGTMGTAANPRPTTIGGVFAFGDVNAPGASLRDFGPLLAQVTDRTVATQPISRFALAVTQRLCYFANSAPCAEEDAEFRRIALGFQTSNFNFFSLIRELFSSSLVTGASATTTFTRAGIPVSIARRDQLCAALSNRLNRPDLCSLAVALPTSAQSATSRTAASVPADAFSRGSEAPITASDPTLFYAAGAEALCENLAAQVVDATTNTVYSSSDSASAMADMVSRVMGYPTTDPHYGPALQILQENYDASVAQRAKATDALRSTFALACQSPTVLSFGL